MCCCVVVRVINCRYYQILQGGCQMWLFDLVSICLSRSKGAKCHFVLGHKVLHPEYAGWPKASIHCVIYNHKIARHYASSVTAEVS